MKVDLSRALRSTMFMPDTDVQFRITPKGEIHWVHPEGNHPSAESLKTLTASLNSNPNFFAPLGHRNIQGTWGRGHLF